MGVAGVAIATITSQAVSAILSYVYIKKKCSYFNFQKGDFKFDKTICKNLLRLGLPSAIQSSAIAIGIIAIQMAINNLGSSDYVAAYSIGVKIEQLFSQFYHAIGIAVLTYTGQNLGAGNIDRIQKGTRASFILCIIWSFITLFIGLEETAQNQNVINNAMIYVRICVYFFMALALICVYRNAIQGLGNGEIPLLSTVLELFLRIAVVIVSTTVFNFGFLGINLANTAAWIGAAIMLPLCYFHMIKKIKKWNLGRQE